MKTWQRTAPLDSPRATRRTETWTYSDGTQPIASFDVEVTLGKPLDVMRLKGTSLAETRDYAAFLAQTADKLYRSGVPNHTVTDCPCCGEDVHSAPEAVTIFGVAYRRCPHCGHVFVGTRPDLSVLNALFAESEEHSAVYTDPASLETRLAQIVQPKLEWALAAYRTAYGQDVSRVIDVGAGGGHFVEVCRRAGLQAEGYEISKASRQFAKQAFDLTLNPQDYLTTQIEPGACNLITFWGLLEYIQEPCRFLEQARRQLDPHNGMIVVEVPRFDCISSESQRLFPDRVARHLDPTSHVNCFSDSSLATALYRCGFKPVAAWYFGMDAYEMLVQLALELDSQPAIEQLARLIPGLQAAFDSVEFCDDLVLAAVPV